MANVGPGTNNSQFFVTFRPVWWLSLEPNKHTIFGEVVSGQEVIELIELQGYGNGQPRAEVRIADCGIL